jgi:hypothetical protein
MGHSKNLCAQGEVRFLWVHLNNFHWMICYIDNDGDNSTEMNDVNQGDVTPLQFLSVEERFDAFVAV